jgi:hypothetical protein
MRLIDPRGPSPRPDYAGGLDSVTAEGDTAPSSHLNAKPVYVSQPGGILLGFTGENGKLKIQFPAAGPNPLDTILHPTTDVP